MGFPNAFCFCNFAILQLGDLSQCVAYKEKKRPGAVGTPGPG